MFYIYDMISGMSRVDVKNVLLIMYTDSVILGFLRKTKELLQSEKEKTNAAENMLDDLISSDTIIFFRITT